MNYRIAEEKAVTVIGKAIIIRKDAFQEIPTFVEESWKNGTHDRINQTIGNSVGTLLYGYYFDFNEDGTKRYLMGAEMPDGIEVPEDFTVICVPDQTYAVFDSRESITKDVENGLEIQNVWKRIYAEWFPSANFEQVEGPCVEKYFRVDDRQVDGICEVWIPVKRKINL